jgi:hypothetical protein
MCADVSSTTTCGRGDAEMKSTKTTDEMTAAEGWLAQLEPAEVRGRDGKYLRNVTEAAERALSANAKLRTAVKEARAVGETWAMIGLMLGVTRQAAFQRFGRATSETLET